MITEGTSVRLPILISPCPIIECAITINFDDSRVIGDAVFGIVYNEFKEVVEKVEKLPILQIPEALRSADPNLIFQATHRLHCKDFILQVGPRIFSISFVGEYPGWEKLSKTVQNIFDKISALGFIQNISKFSIRYINLFDNIDIFNNLTLLIKKDNLPVKSKSTVLRFELMENEFLQILHIANPFQVNLQGMIRNGAVIDIDTVFQGNLNSFFEEFSSILSRAHYIEKVLFFGLLDPGYLKQLDPVY